MHAFTRLIERAAASEIRGRPNAVDLYKTAFQVGLVVGRFDVCCPLDWFVKLQEPIPFPVDALLQSSEE